jgi:predicted proteasome-type protease
VLVSAAFSLGITTAVVSQLDRQVQRAEHANREQLALLSEIRERLARVEERMKKSNERD